MSHYILEGREIVPVDDLMTWAGWMETAGDKRIVNQTHVGDVLISTVFLGMDHSFGSGPPLLFETMVFKGELNHECDRYASYAEAETGHESMVSRVIDAQFKLRLPEE